MANFRNVSGTDLFLAGIGVVKDQGVVEDVPDERLYEYTASANFEPVGAVSQSLHDQAVQDEADAVGAEQEERRQASGMVDHPDAGKDDVEGAASTSSDKPAGNASRDEWAAYVLGVPLATEDEIKDLSRDELRDSFGG